MKYKKWYEAKLLFCESRSGKFIARRYYTLLKENTPKKALVKAKTIGDSIDYPYEKSLKLKWEFLGVQHLLECYQNPGDKAIIFHYGDEGKSWDDAVSYVQPYSSYEISFMSKSPYGLYHAELTYFIRKSNRSKVGQVSTIQVMFRHKDVKKLLSKIYDFAVSDDVKRHILKIRFEKKRNQFIEFAGIGEVKPIYETIHDGMEIWRSEENYKTRKEMIKLIPNDRSLF